jgi:peptidoglycan hydrolase CwlO-like protein
MKKKIISAVLAVALVMSSSIPAFATPNQEVLENQQKYEELTKKIDEITGEIVALSAEIEPLLVTIENNKTQMEEIKIEVKNTEKEIESTKEEIQKTEEILGKRIRELYKSGGQGSYLMLLFSADSFNDLISKIESTSRLVSIDKKIVKELVEKQESLNKKIASLDEKNKELVSINEQNEKSLKECEVKKAEQEKLVQEVKAEQAVFERDYLAVSERKLVEYQVGIIEDSTSSLENLQNAISQLRDIRDNQIKSSIVVEEINGYIETAKVKVEEIEAALEAERLAAAAAAATPTPNRGTSSASTSSASTSTVVNYAYGFLGTDYIWGGTTPSPGFDCSGFTSYVFRNAAGIEITRTTGSQMGVGTPVSYDDLQVGDLVFTYGGGHVGIYIGGGNYIHSSQPGDVVKVSPITSFYTARRVL